MDEIEPSPKYYSVLLRGLLVLYGLPALALFLQTFLGLGPSMGLTLLACLPAAMLMRDYAGVGLALSLIGLVLAGMSCYSLDTSQRISRGVKLENITVAEAYENRQANVFYFKDAKIQQELRGKHQFKPRGKNRAKVTYYVAPLTDSDWTPEDPVQAWVVSASYESTKRWKLDFQSGIRWQSSPNNVREHAAIGDSEEKHGLTLSTEPLLIKWDDPEKLYQESLSRLKFAFTLPFWLWVVGLSIHWVRKSVSSAP